MDSLHTLFGVFQNVRCTTPNKLAYEGHYDAIFAMIHTRVCTLNSFLDVVNYMSQIPTISSLACFLLQTYLLWMCVVPTRSWTWTPASVCVARETLWWSPVPPTSTSTGRRASVCAMSALLQPLARPITSSTGTPASACATRCVRGTSRLTGPHAPVNATSHPTGASSEDGGFIKQPAGEAFLLFTGS